jgi:adenylyl cyclase-associated protein
MSTPAPPAAPAPQPAAAPSEPLPESITEFDAFISSGLDSYVKASNQLGGLIAEQVSIHAPAPSVSNRTTLISICQAAKVLQGFREQRKFLLISTLAKKPDLSGSEMAVYQDLLKPINEALMAVSNIKESNRPSPVFGQLSAVADGIMVLAWVTVDNRPWKHVDECLGSAQFFGNRVLKEQKDKSVF